MTMPWSRLRRPIQILFLVAFAVLTIGGLRLGFASVFSAAFSRLDPLGGLSAMIASRALEWFWAPALITVAATILLGRVWCGWVCPLGTIVEITPVPAKLAGPRAKSPRWALGRYATLAVVLGAAAIGNLGPMILDPVTIITRPLQELARPLAGSDAVGESIGRSLGSGAVHAVAFLSLVPLVLVVAASVFGRRFWCRSLCPLGGLLALLARVPGVRRFVVAETCTSCARCAKACPTGAIARTEGFPSSSAECITCLTCNDACQTGANRFGFSHPRLFTPAYEPSRRDALVAIGATGMGLAAVVLPVARTDAEILRPPATDEARLSELCVRCGACYGACPTGSLRPSVSFTSKAGPWTPMLDERPGHCTMRCNRCAVPCPTDAIHTPTEMEILDLGLAVRAEINPKRCRAWARNHECMACQKVCPIAGAIVGEERPATQPKDAYNDGPPVQVPVVNTDQCVGCNLCAGACPMTPAAIGSPLPPQPPPGALRMPRGMPGGLVPPPGMGGG
jgi:ferredoxin